MVSRFLRIIALSALFLFAVHSGATMSKYEWTATECAPKDYPMKIVSGLLHYVGETDAGLYVPSGGTINKGWGTSVSTHLVGPQLKPLPERLHIVYFSHTENQFYRGEFKLPYDRIATLFKEGYYNARDREHTGYREIMVGVAPGGTVAVWLLGVGKTTEVFLGRAEKADVDWRRVNDNPEISRKDYIERRLAESLSPETLKRIKERPVPVDLWQRFHARYRWAPVFMAVTPPEVINYVGYLNGEEDTFVYPISKAVAGETRATPRAIHFPWVTKDGRKHSVQLSFDETETLAAFEKLGSRQQALELEIKMDEATRQLLVWLRNNQESLELKKISSKRYGG
jgi:hypothetical protein